MKGVQNYLKSNTNSICWVHMDTCLRYLKKDLLSDLKSFKTLLQISSMLSTVVFLVVEKIF